MYNLKANFRTQRCLVFKVFAVVFLLVLCSFKLIAQEDSWQEEGAKTKNKPFRFDINKAEGYYIKFTGSLQTWFRHTELNPGSLIALDAPASEVTDISLRRFRLGISGLIASKTFFSFNMGVNNVNFLSNKKTSINILDAYSEFRHAPWLHVGVGKSAWKGLSRYSSPSPNRSLSLDVPIVAQPTINITDDLLRNLSIFFKGQKGKLDYRITTYKPQVIDDESLLSGGPEEGVAKFTDSKLDGSFGMSGYFKWHMKDKDGNNTPFGIGSYLGEKDMLTFGAGFEVEGSRTYHLEQGNVQYNDMNLMAMDLFYEHPFDPVEKNAFTAYLAYFYYDFGPNFVRNIGVNNPAAFVDTDLASFNGRGNAYPIIGSGNAFYLQIGYLTKELARGRLQPNLSIQYAAYNQLDDPMLAYDVGMNWLLKGHLSRFAINYQFRPIYYERSDKVEMDGYKGMFVLMYQFRFE